MPFSASSPLNGAAWLSDPARQRMQHLEALLNHDSAWEARKAHAQDLHADAVALRWLTSQFNFWLNSCSAPILRLPPEVMGEIMTIVAAVDPPTSSNLSSGWMGLSQVSRQVRSVLLSMHALWADAVFLVDSDAREEVLRRAGETPLYIKMRSSVGDTVGKRAIELAMSNITRARHVEILEGDHGHEELWTRDPLSLAGADFPHLETLILDVYHRPSRDATWLRQPVYDYAPIIAPRLRRLRLKNIFVPFVATQLTRLELIRAQHTPDSNILNDESIIPSAPQFLSILRQCANVQTLRIANYTSPDLQPLPPHLRKHHAIEFPALTTLDLYEKLPRCYALWTHLSVPPTAKLDIDVDYSEYPNHDRPYLDSRRLDLLDAVGAHSLRSPPSRRTSGLAILNSATSGFSTFRFTFFAHEAGAEKRGWTGPLGRDHILTLDLTFRRFLIETLFPFTQAVERARSSFALEDIRTLDLGFESYLGEVSQWKAIFAAFPRVHTLNMYKMHHSAYDALTPVFSAEVEGEVLELEPGALLLPELTTLSIETLRFQGVPRPMEDEVTLDPIFTPDNVVEMFSARKRAGAPVQNVKIVDLDMGDYDLDMFITKMRAVVPQVEYKPLSSH
ncbi:hypothetical protein PENSPDRAFT_680918 [Peniophora sp. CONT]|nr:hypothetical protein PENSPDRAFT_680918 [Peniophora sp. CONT]